MTIGHHNCWALIGLASLLACTPRGAEEPRSLEPSGPAKSEPEPGLEPEPEPEPGPPPAGIIGLVAGVHHSCALKQGRVYCWGVNRFGILGVGEDLGVDVTRPQPVRGLDEVGEIVKLGLDYDFSCVLTADGGVYCWGDNGSGQLGTGDTIPRASPTRVAGITPASGLSVRFQRVCTLGEGTSKTWCWGSGEFGDGQRYHEQVTPISIEVLAGIDHLAYACSLRRGEVLCWGDNSGGQVGNGEGGCEYDEPPCPQSRCLPARTCKHVDTPVEPVGLPDAAIVELEGGGNFVYARDADGVVWQWGQVGQTMSFDPRPNYRPQPHTELPPVVEVSAGSSHACARTEAGELWCWGNDSFGQLGFELVGRDSERPPHKVEGVPAVRAIAAGFYYTCVLAGDRDTSEIWCWGDNSAGQLGDGTTERRHTPASVRW